MLVDFKTKTWEELANINPAFPSWSRDGQYVHFHSYGTDESLYCVQISDYKVEKIVGLREIRLAVGAIGTGVVWPRMILPSCCAMSVRRKSTPSICSFRDASTNLPAPITASEAKPEYAKLK
jgi:hypothetical protein